MATWLGEDIRTLVVVPSISFPSVELRKITGICHYEERMLFATLYLDDPALRVIYVTSLPIDRAIADYYLSFLSDPQSARSRVHLVALDDPEPSALSAKLLKRPDALEAIGSAVSDRRSALLMPFNVTAWEVQVADALGIPLWGAGLEHAWLGSKSGSRTVARAAGVPVLPGAEDLFSVAEVERAVTELRSTSPGACFVVVKLNYGFSGQGNAIVDLAGLASPLEVSSTVFCAEEESWPSFRAKIEAEGAVVEELVRAPGTVSPSVQIDIGRTGCVEILSTHDQVLGGPDDQVYLGCRFPARAEYRELIVDYGRRVATELASRGVRGPFGIDFIVIPSGTGYRAYLSEINLRLGGTTHPFAMARLVTKGRYEQSTGELLVGAQPKSYVATDNLKSTAYVGLSPQRVIEAVARRGLAFDQRSNTGVALHLLGALEGHGKMGLTCIADTPAGALALYDDAIAVVDELSTI